MIKQEGTLALDRLTRQTLSNAQDRLIGRVMAEHCDKRIAKAVKAINREEKYLQKLRRRRTVGPIMQGDIEGAFHRMRVALGGKDG